MRVSVAGFANGEAKLQYRADVDGLRAVAVVPVVLFHAALGPFSGGYVGVDVFFVISGYLITKVLLHDIDTRGDRGGLSLLSFYERRIRRIFPALFVMLGVSFVAFAAILAPVDLLRMSRSVIATVAFASNILFFREAGYFEPAGELQPLLHTWSLAVEEQFYIVFPILLAILARFKRARQATLIALTAASFALSIWATNRAPDFNFYLPFTRAWELLLGALLATSAARAPGRLAEPIAIAGLALILGPVFLYQPTTPFPGLAALPPVLGAAIIIWAAEGTATGRLLSNRAIVYVGRISYSLYLWHWPVLVFGRYWNLFDMGPGSMVLCVAIAFGLAILSYHFVEAPFRHKARFNRSRIFVGAGAFGAALVGTALVSLGTQGMAFRNAAAAREIGEITAQLRAFNHAPCLKLGGTIPDRGECRLGAVKPATIVLWGDSHAAQLAAALDTAGKAQGFAIRQITKAGCPPILSRSFFPASPLRRDCPVFNQAALDVILTDANVRTVVIAGRWDTIVKGVVRVSDEGPVTPEESVRLASASIARTVSTIQAQGVEVILVNQIPLPGRDLFLCYRTARFNGWSSASCDRFDAKPVEDLERRVTAMLPNDLPAGGRLRILNARSAFCGSGSCSARTAAGAVFMDEVHLTQAGSAQLVDRLRPVLTPGPSYPTEEAGPRLKAGATGF